MNKLNLMSHKYFKTPVSRKEKWKWLFYCVFAYLEVKITSTSEDCSHWVVFKVSGIYNILSTSKTINRSIFLMALNLIKKKVIKSPKAMLTSSLHGKENKIFPMNTGKVKVRPEQNITNCYKRLQFHSLLRDEIWETEPRSAWKACRVFYHVHLRRWGQRVHEALSHNLPFSKGPS